MIVIIKQDAVKEIVGWIIATDVHDARRQAAAAFDHVLASELYRHEFLPAGKHRLACGHTLLVA